MRLLLTVLSAAMATTSVTVAAAEEVAAPAKPNLAIETSVPKPDCAQPKLPPHLPTAAQEVASLYKQVDAYAACTTRYVDERRAQAQKHSDLAKEEAEASNAAVKEINDFYAGAKHLVQNVKKSSN